MIDELRARLSELLVLLKERLRGLDPKILLALRMAGLLLVLFLAYQITLARSTATKIELQQTLKERRELALSMKQRIEQLPQLEKRVQLFGSEEGKSELFIPPVPRLIQHLGNMSQEIPLKVIQVTLGNDQLIDPTYNIQEIPVTIEIMTDYRSLQTYISDLYQLPQLFALQKVKIAQNKVLNPYSITATLDFKLYYSSTVVRLPASEMVPTPSQAPAAPAGTVPAPSGQPPTAPSGSAAPQPVPAANPPSPPTQGVNK